MPTLTVAKPARGIRTRPVRLTVAASPASEALTGAAFSWSTGPRDQLVIVSVVGGVRSPLAELRSAVIVRPTWRLNAPGSLGFRCPADDPSLLDAFAVPSTIDLGAGEPELLGREVEWWRDGELRWAGPVVSMEVDAATGVVSFQAATHEWYLNRRVMGAAERRDLLGGRGSMDQAGLPGWTRSGGATAVRDTADKQRGAGSAQITGGGGITLTFRFPAVQRGQDTTVRLTALVKAPSNTPVGSLLASIWATPVGDTERWRPLADNAYNTTDDFPLNSWQRVDVWCLVKPGVAHDVRVTLWAPTTSAIRFDDVRALRNDTTGFPAPGRDLTAHGAALIDHAQRGRGKGTFGLKRKVLSLAGTTEPMGVRHMEHSNVWDLLEGYTEREDGFDVWVDPRTRTVLFAARRGQDQGVPISDRTVVAGGWVQDETQRASSVIVLGDGSEVERPEGGYLNASRTRGMVLDLVHRPANGTPLSALDPMAKAIHDRSSRPQVTQRPLTVPASWWDEYGVQPGDRFPSWLAVGVLRQPSSAGWFRVQEIVHDLESETLELV